MEETLKRESEREPMAPKKRAPRAENRKHNPKPADAPAMHILKFQATNILGLKVVEINPKGHVVKLTGDNGAGKSSVLDAIMYALTGVTGLPSEIIRRGEDKGGMRIDLGDLVVTRTFTRNGVEGGVLKVMSTKQRSVLQGAQGVLDSFMGRISFDPLEFTRMRPDRQLETLRGLVQVDIDIDALDAANKADYEERRILGRQVDALKVKLAEAPVVEGEPGELVDVQALAAKLAEAGRENLRRMELQGRQATMRSQYDTHTDQAADLRRQVVELNEKIRAMQETAEILGRQALEHDEEATKAKSAEEAIKIPAPIDTTGIEADIRAAEATNAEVNRKLSQREQRGVIEGAIEEGTAKMEQLTEAREKRLTEREEAIARAKMPIEGLSFGEGEVLYKGLPLAQASSAEQITASVALAMASNPTIRVLRIKDGSLLSAKSLEIIAAMAEEQNYQVWIELVDTSGKVGVVMEDGEAHDAER